MREKFSAKGVKHLFLSLFMLLLFMLIVITVNVMVDPSNILRDDVAQEAAQIMAQGSNAENVKNLKDRNLLSYYAGIRQEPIDILALGSSRIMQLSQEMVSDTENYFCAGVTGSDLRDCIDTYFLFANEVNTPEKVIIVAESWFLSDGNLDPRANTEYYTEFCQSINSVPLGEENPYEEYLEFASFSYFQGSLDSVFSGSNRLEITPTSLEEGVNEIRRADGSYSYSEEYRNGGALQSNNLAMERTIYGSMSSLYTGINGDLQFQFESFVDTMMQNGVEVEILLVPFHPLYFDYMQTQEEYEGIVATQEYFEQFAHDRDIEIIGSYNPYTLGFDANDFYDAVHITDFAMQELYSNRV